MTERQMLSEWIVSMREHCHAEKIPDMPFMDGARFQPKKPYDCFYVKDGIHNAVEAKKTNGLSFNTNTIEEHQHKALKKNSESGGKSWILIFVYYEIKSKPEFLEWAKENNLVVRNHIKCALQIAYDVLNENFSYKLFDFVTAGLNDKGMKVYYCKKKIWHELESVK